VTFGLLERLYDRFRALFEVATPTALLRLMKKVASLLDEEGRFDRLKLLRFVRV
jgi:hypothetical protein